MKKKWIITAAIIAVFCLAAGAFKYFKGNKSSGEGAEVVAQSAPKKNVLNFTQMLVWKLLSTVINTFGLTLYMEYKFIKNF